ncbi:TfuA-like protein [Lysobacter sp. A286]
MRPIVFLGLSLTGAEARAVLDAEYRAPIVRGDLDAIVAPAQVVIVDGMLDPDLRLHPEEAARALARGLDLHGAASMGAVLAVRLEPLGMKGAGQVFHILRTLGGDREDLVQALFVRDGLEFRPLTVPLINVVAGLWSSGLGAGELAALVHVLRAIALDARTWENIEAAVAGAGFRLPPAIRLMDAKREDALCLLRQLR